MDSQIEDITSYTSLLNGEIDVPMKTRLEKGGSKQRRGCNFNTDEDKLLVSGWLNISLDDIYSKDNSLEGYWKRVNAYYLQGKDPSWPKRTVSSLSHRWSIIQKAVSKFCGCLTQIESLNKSGVSQEDNIPASRKMFLTLTKKPFRYDNCWILLRNEPKWHDRSTTIGTKRKSQKQSFPSNKETTIVLDDNQALSDDNNIERPTGRKAAKERKKLAKSLQVDPAFSSALSVLKAEKKKAHDEKMLKLESTTEQRTELLEIQKAQLLETREANIINHAKVKLQRDKEDTDIMFKDTSRLYPAQKEYLQIHKMKILQRSRNDLQSD